MTVQLNFIEGRPIAVGIGQGKGIVIFPEKLAQVIDKIKIICENHVCDYCGRGCDIDKILEVINETG